ncbi:hypothetical protein LINGRAHAP2_LOCUS7632 [Linum grandiflorum]
MAKDSQLIQNLIFQPSSKGVPGCQRWRRAEEIHNPNRVSQPQCIPHFAKRGRRGVWLPAGWHPQNPL